MGPRSACTDPSRSCYTHRLAPPLADAWQAERVVAVRQQPEPRPCTNATHRLKANVAVIRNSAVWGKRLATSSKPFINLCMVPVDVRLFGYFTLVYRQTASRQAWPRCHGSPPHACSGPPPRLRRRCLCHYHRSLLHMHETRMLEHCGLIYKDRKMRVPERAWTHLQRPCSG